MLREDLSSKLIHLTRDFNNKSAKDNFLNILCEESIKGSHTYVRGGFDCVCFTEAPISTIGRIIAAENSAVKYSPFGFTFSKEYLFNKGARPVIYQPENQFELLHDEIKYRHVRFDLSKSAIPDWTWEREWRIKTDRLKLEIQHVTAVVPTREIMHEMIYKHKMFLAEKFKNGVMEMPFHYIILEDLGITFA